MSSQSSLLHQAIPWHLNIVAYLTSFAYYLLEFTSKVNHSTKLYCKVSGLCCRCSVYAYILDGGDITLPELDVWLNSPYITELHQLAGSPNHSLLAEIVHC